jgi:hypothetical protein
MERRKTQKRHKTFWKHTNLEYFGAGSFGRIYSLGPRVMKIHTLQKGVETCEDWKREFETQRAAHRLCTNALFTVNAYIARPYEFSYGNWNTSRGVLTKHANYTRATSCFYTMERIYGRLPGSNNVEGIYASIVPTFRPKYTLPPYLFLGALEYQMSAESNVIALDMMKDTTLVEFPREGISYCNILPHGIAYTYIQSITAAFFILVEKGFLPRDVEFLFDSHGKIAIIDFNEVRRVDPATIESHIGEIANVYIDLCGARDKSDRNPFFAADEPTPQWKFLCNPKTSPQGFCQLLESFPTNSFQQKVLLYVLDYVRHKLAAVQPTMVDRAAAIWNPVKPFFSKLEIAREFDYAFQKYILYNLYDLCARRGIDKAVIDDSITTMDYETALLYFQGLLNKKGTVVGLENDVWESPLW